MKKSLLLVTVLLSLIATGVASAKGPPPPPPPPSTTPYTFTGTAGSGGTTFAFVNPTEGAPLRFDTSWTYKAGGRWVIWVKHLTDPSNTYSYDQWCEVDGGAVLNEWSWSRPGLDLIGYSPGVSTCEFNYAEAGTWTIKFMSMVGKTDFSVLITTPVLNPSPVPAGTYKSLYSSL